MKNLKVNVIIPFVDGLVEEVFVIQDDKESRKKYEDIAKDMGLELDEDGDAIGVEDDYIQRIVTTVSLKK